MLSRKICSSFNYHCLCWNALSLSSTVFLWACEQVSWIFMSVWSCALKFVLHFTPAVAKRSVFCCVHIISSAWVFTRQWNTLRFAKIRVKWRTTLRCYNIDNQQNRLETQAKVSMLLTRHPWYGLICCTLEPCNFTLNILQDFLFTYFKQERQSLWNYRLLKFFMDITKLKPNAECLHSFWLQKCRHCCCWKRFTETLNGDFPPRLSLWKVLKVDSSIHISALV